jgi:dienelactone hydrolase
VPTTRRAFLVAAPVAFAALGCTAFAAPAGYAEPGPYTVKALEGVWHDGARSRDVPWLVRLPEGHPGAAPLVIFSHGLGGNRNNAVYYSEHLASHGYVVAHVEHPGTNTDSLRGDFRGGQGGGIDYQALGQAAASPKAAIDRFRDIPYALDQLTAMTAAEGPFKGLIDMARVGMSGHSYGAVTTQAMAGQVYPLGSLGEPRFKAFLPMSPSGDRRGDNARAFSGFTRPIFFMTGTEDSVKVPGTNPDPLDRQKPFQFTPAATPAVQLVFNGGDHMIFSGPSPLRPPRPTDEPYRTLIKAGALAFWDAYLKGDDAALHWLRDGGFRDYVGASGVINVKGPAR